MSELTAERTSTVPRPAARIHPRFIEFGSLLLIAPLCVVGAIIGVQLIVTLGITANTSLIGALAGMALARIPLRAFLRYRSRPVGNRPIDPVHARRLDCVGRHCLPRAVAALRQGPGHAGIWRRHDRGQCAVRVLHLHLEGDFQVG